MDPEGQTLNTGGETTSSADSSAAGGNFDAFIPTMPEDQPKPVQESSAETQNTVPEGEAKKEEGQEAEGQKAPEKVETPEKGDEGKAPEAEAKAKDSEAEPFHKHPRFQQLIGKNKELESQLQEMQKQFEAVVKQTTGKVKELDPEAQFAEIFQKLEDGELSTAQAMEEQRKLIEASSQQRLESVMQEQRREAEAQRLQDKFLGENPDFKDLRDSGELEEVINVNPMHDTFSAYYAHKAAMLEQAVLAKEKEADAKVSEAVAKAVKETEERVRKEFASKRNAASLSESSAHVPKAADADDQLDSKGNRLGLLAQRLKARREARA